MFWYVTKGYRSSSITSHVLSLFLDTLMLWTNIAIAHRPFDVFSIDGSCSHLCPVGPYVQYGVCTVTYVYQKNEPTCKHIHIYKIYIKNTLIFMGFSQISTKNTPCVFFTPIGFSTGCSLAECLGPLCVEDLVKGGSKCCGIHSSLVQRVSPWPRQGVVLILFASFLPSFFWGGAGGTHIGEIETWCKALLDFEGFSWTKNRAFVWVGNTKTAVGAASLRDCWCIKCNCVIQPMKRGHIERNNFLPTAIFQG